MSESVASELFASANTSGAPVTQQAMETIPDLRDPLVMGERLGALLERTLELAPIYCTDCEDMHVKWVRHRVENDRSSFYTFHPELVGAVVEAVGLLHRRGKDRLRIMIAGAADTGLLALCAHVVSLQKAFPADSVHFHVVDRCRTPLILCEEFAARHGLSVTTCHSLIPDGDSGLGGNLILGSSLLRFFPPERQPRVLEYLAAQHEPGDVFVYGHILARVPPPTPAPGNAITDALIHAMIMGAGYEFDQETISDRHMLLRSGASRELRWYTAVATRT
jgi:hypothetical protein